MKFFKALLVLVLMAGTLAVPNAASAQDQQPAEPEDVLVEPLPGPEAVDELGDAGLAVVAEQKTPDQHNPENHAYKFSNEHPQ